MLKIRYIEKTGLLTGWLDNELEFELLATRKGEAVALLDVTKPDVDDYQCYSFIGDKLIFTGKIPLKQKRDYGKEIDEIIERLDTAEIPRLDKLEPK